MKKNRTVELEQKERDYLTEMSTVEKTNGEYFCHKCKDTGYTLSVTDDGNEVADTCECKSTKWWHDLFLESGIAPELFGKTMDDWNLQQDAYGNDLGADKKRKKKIGEFMRKYLKIIPALIGGGKMEIKRKQQSTLFINSLLLLGGRKSGKSMLASIAVQEALRNGFTAKIYDWTELNKTLPRYDLREELDEIEANFKNCDLIVVDNVQDYNQKSNFFILQLDSICRKRWASGKPIIITSDSTYPTISNGNSWNNMLDSCYMIKLPSPVKPQSIGG